MPPPGTPIFGSTSLRQGRQITHIYEELQGISGNLSDPDRNRGRIPGVPMTVSRVPRSVSTVIAEASPEGLLLDRIRAGDEQALARVYDLHADLVFGLARRVTRDEQLAGEITQEVFAYLWELPTRVDLTRGSLRSYLAVVTHRRAVDEIRRNERRMRTETAAARADREDGPEAAVVEAAASAWGRDRLAAALRALPPDQRRAVQLAYYDGLTYKQVASVLAIPEGTAKSRLRLAIARLRTLLGDEARTALR
jgi:RNA polymerase sigma-70 factor, ECF subfamily